MKVFVVKENEAGQRFDKLLAKYLNKAPKSFIYKMLRKKNIVLNGKKATGSEILSLEDEVTLYLADETFDKFSAVEVGDQVIEHNLKILYEDKDVLILNKPAGVLSQKAKPEDVSLVEEIIAYLFTNDQLTMENLRSFKPGVCNRLDRNTSGVVVAGKSLAGLQKMSKMFQDRTLDKFYLCIVAGEVRHTERIEGYLIKDKKTNQVSIYPENRPDADYISTEYKLVVSNKEYSLLSVKLITGRTHQIRAHLSSIGHPIIGDSKYGNRYVNDRFKKRYHLNHQLLHSYQTIFPVIEGSDLSEKTIIAPIPDYFKTIRKDLFHE